jgi:hypothetical protein
LSHWLDDFRKLLEDRFVPGSEKNCMLNYFLLYQYINIFKTTFNLNYS